MANEKGQNHTYIDLTGKLLLIEQYHLNADVRGPRASTALLPLRLLRRNSNFTILLRAGLTLALVVVVVGVAGGGRGQPVARVADVRRRGVRRRLLHVRVFRHYLSSSVFFTTVDRLFKRPSREMSNSERAGGGEMLKKRMERKKDDAS